MNKTYGFLVTHTIGVHYEVGGKDEEDARKALDVLLDEEDLDLADFDISDTEITCLGEIKPSYRVYFDGQNLHVKTDSGSASMNVEELIDELCARADRQVSAR